MEYAESFRDIRERMGWTQADLAQKLGITQVMVSQIESGARNPSVALRYKISAFMAGIVLEQRLSDISGSNIVQGDRNTLVVNGGGGGAGDDEGELLRGFRALTRRDRTKLLAYMYELEENADKSKAARV